MTLEIEIPEALELRLREAAAQRGLDEREYVVRTLEAQVTRVLADSGPVVPNKDEQLTLIAEIGKGLPAPVLERYNDLVEKRLSGTLSNDERQELNDLVQQVELDHAERMERVARLAQLRGVTLSAAMNQLGLKQASIR